MDTAHLHPEDALTLVEVLELLAIALLPGLLLAIGIVITAQRRARRRASGTFLFLTLCVWVVVSLPVTVVFWMRLPYINPFLWHAPVLDTVGPVLVPGLAAQAVVLPVLFLAIRHHLRTRLPIQADGAR